MTSVNNAPSKEPLRVFSIITDGLSVLNAKFFSIIFITFAVSLLGFLINGALFGFDVAAGLRETFPFGSTMAALQPFLMPFIDVLTAALTTTLIVHLVYITQLGQKKSVWTIVQLALPPVFPVTLLSILVSILGILSLASLAFAVGGLGSEGLAGLGLLVLFIFALWCAATFYATIPAMVIERAGFFALRRSARLTKRYRWGILLLLILIAVVSVALMLAIGPFLIGLAPATASASVFSITVGVIAAMISGLTYAFSGIIMTLTYMRLREIKETLPLDQVAEVFE